MLVCFASQKAISYLNKLLGYRRHQILKSAQWTATLQIANMTAGHIMT